MDILINLGYNEQIRPTDFSQSLANIKQEITNEKYWKYYCSLPKTIMFGNNKDTIERDNSENGKYTYYGVERMNHIFYGLMKDLKRIPHWKEFINAYKDIYCTRINNTYLTFKSDKRHLQYHFEEKKLENKLLRAYMSFLKEVYAMFYLRDKGLHDLYYSVEMDDAGFDITIINRYGAMFGIRVYCKTDRAEEFADIKAGSRMRPPKGSTIISLEAKVGKDSIKIGDTCIFENYILNSIYHYINNNIQINFDTGGERNEQPKPGSYF